jgi:hypothetical protein
MEEAAQMGRLLHSVATLKRLVADKLTGAEMPQLLEGAQLNLAHSLTGYLQPAANLFESTSIAIIQAEAHTENILFSHC